MNKYSVFIVMLLLISPYKSANSSDLPDNPWASDSTINAVRLNSEERNNYDDIQFIDEFNEYPQKRSIRRSSNQENWATRKAALVRQNNKRIRNEARQRQLAEIKRRQEEAKRRAEQIKANQNKNEKSFGKKIQESLQSLNDNGNNNTNNMSNDDTFDFIKGTSSTHNNLKAEQAVRKIKRMLKLN